jgi:hypothetical protein
LLAAGDRISSERYFTSGAPKLAAEVMKQLLGQPVTLELLPERFRSVEMHSPASLTTVA